MRRIRAKLRARRGVTLGELLVAMAVLGLMAAAVSTGIMAGVKVYHTSTGLSQSQLLLSTLTQRVSDELRYARDIHASDVGVVYTSPAYGPKAALLAPDGQVAVSSGGSVSALLGSGSYGEYLADIDVDYADDCFQVALTISSPGGEELQNQSFSVRALNPST